LTATSSRSGSRRGRTDGRVAVEVDQTVRDLNGVLLSEGRVRHVYTYRDGLVVAMEVE
jgi:hypothetical protein